MDNLKTILGELYTPEIEAKLQGKNFIIDDGKMIPKYRFDEINEQKKGLQEQIDKHVNDLTEIKKQVKGSEELETKIKEIQKANDELVVKHNQEFRNLKADVKRKELLATNGVVNTDAIDVLLPKFKHLEYKEETNEVIGFNEEFEKIKSNPTFHSLITTVQRVGTGYHEQVPATKITLTEQDKLKARDMNLDEDSYLELKQKFPDKI